MNDLKKIKEYQRLSKKWREAVQAQRDLEAKMVIAWDAMTKSERIVASPTRAGLEPKDR